MRHSSLAGLLALLLVALCGCTGTGALPGPTATPSPQSPGEDGLLAPEGVDMLSGTLEPVSKPSGLAAIALSPEAIEHFDAARALIGVDQLSDGTLYAWTDTAIPRTSAQYTLGEPHNNFLGALAVPLQPARVVRWLGHPDIVGYAYANDLLGSIDQLDRFITSDALGDQMRLPSALGGNKGVTSLLGDFFEIGFLEDFATWWDGELLMLWVRTEEGLRPVWVFGVYNGTVAMDKAQQMLAMYYFYQRTDRGVYRSESLPSGATLERLVSFEGQPGPNDLGYALSSRELVLGGAVAVSQLLNGAEGVAAETPEAGFAWDSALYAKQPHSFALGFEGGEEGQAIMSKFLERGVWNLPGGGREVAGRMGDFFGGTGKQRVIVDLAPGRFQWWLLGSNAANYQQVNQMWTLAQSGAVLGLAQSGGWDSSPDVMAESSTGNQEARPSLRKQKPRKPLWRGHRR